MRLSLCLTLLAVAVVAVVACTASISALFPPCSSGGADGLAHHCCDLDAHGFDADDAVSIRWLRAQTDTPEFYPITCDWLHQITFDTIGRKMCAVGCWGYPIRIDGVDYDAPTLREAMDALQRRGCVNNFAAGGYWC